MATTIIKLRQEGNRTVGVFMETDGTFFAMTLAKSSHSYKTLNGALSWLSRAGYSDELKAALEA